MKKRPLSLQQLARIRATRDKKQALVNDTALLEHEPSQFQIGRVVASFGDRLQIATDDGRVILCTKRQNLGGLVCFDEVLWEPQGESEGCVVRYNPRSSVLWREQAGRMRPLCSNLDQMVIVVATRPEPHVTTIDRYLIAAQRSQLGTLVIFNKSDLLTSHPDLKTQFEIYSRLGFTCLWLSQEDPLTWPAFRAALAHKVNLLIGPSGVGKSSLTKLLIPDLDIRIGALGAQTGRGTHTTTTARYYALPGGGGLIDAPGIRDFPLGSLEEQALLQAFPELAAAAQDCRFSRCQHRVDPGCGLTEALDQGLISATRVESYLLLRQECQAQAKW